MTAMSADDELHRAKRELEQLVERMRNSEHARVFFGYADVMIFNALRDLQRHEWENPRVKTPKDLREAG